MAGIVEQDGDLTRDPKRFVEAMERNLELEHAVRVGRICKHLLGDVP